MYSRGSRRRHSPAEDQQQDQLHRRKKIEEGPSSAEDQGEDLHLQRISGKTNYIDGKNRGRTFNIRGSKRGSSSTEDQGEELHLRRTSIRIREGRALTSAPGSANI